MTGDDQHGVSHEADLADVVVLGAGISGLVAASVLLAQGASSVVVLDEYPAVGGNHLDVEIGPYTYDVGSFIFQDDSPLLRHFPELMHNYVPITPSWARLNPQGVVTDYPFSIRDDVLAAGPVEVVRIVVSALGARIARRPMRNARDFARRCIGPRFLWRSGLESYMARFCGFPIDQIDLDFARSRMMWISEQTTGRAVLSRLWGLVRRPEPRVSTNRQLARPRSGFATLYAPAVVGLEARGARFALGRRPLAVRRDDDGFVVDTAEGPLRAARLVSTIPVSTAARLCGLDVPALPAVRLLTLFYSFAGTRGFDTSILYNFSHFASWKRLTVYSDFYGEAEGRVYFAVEVIAEARTTEVTAAAEFAEHTRANGLLLGDLRLEGHHVLDEAYPIYTQGSATRAEALRGELRALGIESFGRQGAFSYQPTARVSTGDAEVALGAVPEVS